MRLLYKIVFSYYHNFLCYEENFRMVFNKRAIILGWIPRIAMTALISWNLLNRHIFRPSQRKFAWVKRHVLKPGLDCGLWTMDCGLWTVDCGLWTVDCGLWTVDCGLCRLCPSFIMSEPGRGGGGRSWQFRDDLNSANAAKLPFFLKNSNFLNYCMVLYHSAFRCCAYQRVWKNAIKIDVF